MTGDRMPRAVARLCEQSRRSAVALGDGIAWPDTLADDAWCMSPELVSLHGTDAWAQLADDDRRRVARCEAVNFFSLNIHGEKYLLAGLADRLHRRDYADTSGYLHHFVDEENKHLFYFSTFCRRYAGKIYAHPSLAFPRDYAPGEQDVLFFACILAFEEIVDVYNRKLADDERLAPVVRAINRLHHLDETRHLAFGRLVLRELVDRYAPAWSADTLAGVRAALRAYLESTWRQYYNPEAYRDAGLADAYALARRCYDGEPARRHRAEVARKCTSYFGELGLYVEDR